MTTWPSVPPVEATDFQRPVDGQTLQSFAQAVNYLVGWRFRRALHTEIEFDLSGLASPDRSLLSPAGVGEVVKLTWRTHTKARYAWVHFAYTATHPSGPAATYVDADLRLAFGGAVVDVGCRWDGDRGDLANVRRANVNAGIVGAEYPIQLTHSGVEPDDAAVVQTAPRPLNIGSNTDTDVEVRLTTNAALIHWAEVWELYEREIDP